MWGLNTRFHIIPVSGACAPVRPFRGVEVGKEGGVKLLPPSVCVDSESFHHSKHCDEAPTSSEVSKGLACVPHLPREGLEGEEHAFWCL